MTMKKGIKRFFVAVLAVVAGVAVVDFAVGKVMDWMLPQISNIGDTGKTYYALYDVDAPMVIVGSSRAAHHYVTNMIADSLGVTAYNVGRDGCFFSDNCCVINTILSRYAPQCLVWELGKGSLEQGGEDPLDALFPYYGKNDYVTSSIRDDYGFVERMPFVSNLYKYNSSIQRVLMFYRSRKANHEDKLHGYDPLPPREWVAKDGNKPKEKDVRSVSEVKKRRLEEVLRNAQDKGTRIILVNSPVYMADSTVTLSEQTIMEVCSQYGVQFVNAKCIEGIYDDISLFKDGTHMNDLGAKKYTQWFIENVLVK